MRRLPLEGQTAIVTRPRAQARELAHALRARGARVILAPTVEIRPSQIRVLAPSVRKFRMGHYDWIFFTSVNGVRYWARGCAFVVRQAHHERIWGKTRVAAVGRATAAALKRAGLRVDCVGRDSTAKSLVSAWRRRVGNPRGLRVLLVQPEKPLPDLESGLRRLGVRIDRVRAYRTVRPSRFPSRALKALRADPHAWVAFASPSAARNLRFFLRRARPRIRPGAVRCACIGPTTAEAARRLGFRVALLTSDS